MSIYSELGIPSLTDAYAAMSKMFGPSLDAMKEYIDNAHFSLKIINDKEFLNKWSSNFYNPTSSYVNIIIDGKQINDKIYIHNISLDSLYTNTKKYNSNDTAYEFFQRVDVSYYTKEEAEKYNKDWAKYHYGGKKRKTGEVYLKTTNVIIDLKTGNEVNIIVPNFARGYIQYKYYYHPDNTYELYYIPTGEKILEYDYGSPLETDKHVIFKAKNDNYRDPKRAIILEKETANITYID